MRNILKKIADRVAVLLAFALVFCCAFTAEARFSKKAIIDGYTPVGMTLAADTVYEVQDNVTLNASGVGASALYVNPNTTTALLIPKGITLTVTGGNGNLRNGAGPAIRVPGNSKLVILGEGRLVARGGSGGGATSGTPGTDAKFRSEHPWISVFGVDIEIDINDKYTEFTSGSGGNGGNGGGGAAPGIGGAGGTGGSGGSGRAGYSRGWSWFTATDFNRTGDPGYPGGAGGSGASCGTVVLLGSVRVEASGGGQGPGAGTYAGHGNKADGYTKDVSSGIMYNDYATSGGGGGGGGGNGYPSRYGIGGGAPGAGGAGGGGSGGWFTHAFRIGDVENIHGGAGGAGAGSPAGQSGYGPGIVRLAGVVDTTMRGGAGGASGAAGAYGGDGTLIKSSTASVSCGRGVSSQQDTISELTYRATFDGGDAANTYTKSATFTYTKEFKSVAAAVRALPVAEGRIFAGYYSGSNATGNLFVDSSGNWVRSLTMLADLPLYAFYATEGKCTITFSKGDGGGGENAREVEPGVRKLANTTPPTYAGHIFGGYFTEQNGLGTQVFKSSGECIGAWVTTAGAPYLYAYWIEAKTEYTSVTKHQTLTANCVYHVSGAISASARYNGLVVPGNQKVYICVDSGKSFTVTGGNASGAGGAGAGINLPSSSQLVVFGGGTLTVTGGSAAGGSTGGGGGGGSNYEVSSGTRQVCGGTGGTGGAGGGGAGAGIGGAGGNGGGAKGGPGGPSDSGSIISPKMFHHSGNDGYTGNSGGGGGAAGKAVYVAGSLALTANGRGNGGGGGGNNGGCESYHNSGGFRPCWMACGGGGGGGGGGGRSSWGIGGGGGGGGSGGSGGSGGIVRCDDWQYTYGGGGGGGKGGNNGGSGWAYGREYGESHRSFSCAYSSGRGGNGGGGGNWGGTPGQGTVYLSDSATCNTGNKQTGQATPPELMPTVTFIDCGATSTGTASQVVYMQYGFDRMEGPIVPPAKEGCEFGGYFSEQYGFGTQYFNPDGSWKKGYDIIGSRQLYARWTTTVTVDKTGEGGTVTGGGTVTVGLLEKIVATPAAGWVFTGWSDGSKDATREVLVTGPAAYTANFEPDYENGGWKGYDKDSGLAFASDEDAAAAGYVVRGGRVYYKTLTEAFKNAPDGVRLELIAGVSEAGPFDFGVAKDRVLDGHGFAVTVTNDLPVFDVPAGTSLVLSNATVTGGMNVQVDAKLGLDGVLSIDELSLERGVRIDVKGSLTGSSIGIRSEDDQLTSGLGGKGTAEIFHHLDGAGIGLDADGEAKVCWFEGSGTEDDPYAVLPGIADASISNILADVVKTMDTKYLTIPVPGLASTTPDITFAMPAERSLVFKLDGSYAAGTYDLFGPLAPGFDLSAFSLAGTEAGKLYTLGTNANNVITLTVALPGETIDVPTGESWVLDGFTGDKSLTKAGEGELVLEGANTYSRETIVSNGTLTLLGPLPNSAVTVLTNATLQLGPDADLVRPLVLSNGATLLIPEGATLTNDVTFAAGSILRFAGTGPLVTTDDGTNITWEKPVRLQLDANFINGTYTLVDKLPDGVNETWFHLEGLDDTKDYVLAKDADGKLVVTITTIDLTTKADMTKEDGTPVQLPVVVPVEWLATNTTSYILPESTEEQVNQELNVRAPNGMTYWQNYMLDADPKDKEVKGFTVEKTETPAEANPSNVYFKVNERTIREGSQVALRYRLDEIAESGATVVTGALSTATTVTLPVDAEMSPTGRLYTVRGQFVDKDEVTTTSPETISDGKVYGVIQVTEANKFQAIATPFLDMNSEEDVGTKVADLLQTATLTPGDKLYIYGNDGAYKTFVLDADGKTWNTVPVVKAVGGSTGPKFVAASLPAAASSADDVVTERGMGAWLERQDPSKPFALAGRYSSAVPAVTVAKGTVQKPAYTLLGAPSVTPYNLNGIKGAGEDDQIVIPGAVPKVFVYRDFQWGYYKTVETTFTFFGETQKAVKSVWTTDESSVPPGTGYYFINKSGNDITVE